MSKWLYIAAVADGSIPEPPPAKGDRRSDPAAAPEMVFLKQAAAEAIAPGPAERLAYFSCWMDGWEHTHRFIDPPAVTEASPRLVRAWRRFEQQDLLRVQEAALATELAAWAGGQLRRSRYRRRPNDYAIRHLYAALRTGSEFALATRRPLLVGCFCIGPTRPED